MVANSARDSQDLAAWLSHELDERGWSQSELARRAKVSQPTVSRVLSGMSVSANVLLAIARAIEAPADEIFRHAGLLPLAREVPQSMQEELAREFSRLSDADRARILEVMRTLNGTQPC